MDSRSPLAFLPPPNSPLNTFPRLVNPSKSASPRSSPVPSTSRTPPPSSKLTSSAKRKASFGDDENDDEDSIMATSPQPPARTLKRSRQSPSNSNSSQRRGSLPLSRLLDNLDESSLIKLITSLVERHPDLAPEIQSLVPKLTPQSALGILTKYERQFLEAFPYGGDKQGEYAYSRVHTAYKALLDAIRDYTTYFRPPPSLSSSNSNSTTPYILPAEILSFLDNVTNLLHRLQTWNNPIHNLAKESAMAEVIDAWEAAIRWFLEVNGGFAFTMGGWLDRLEAHAGKEEGFRRIVEEIRRQFSWTRNH